MGNCNGVRTICGCPTVDGSSGKLLKDGTASQAPPLGLETPEVQKASSGASADEKDTASMPGKETMPGKPKRQTRIRTKVLTEEELAARKRKMVPPNQNRTKAPCMVCDKPDANKRCTDCKRFWYCSTECQVQDWEEYHKNECKQLASTLPSATQAVIRGQTQLGGAAAANRSCCKGPKDSTGKNTVE